MSLECSKRSNGHVIEEQEEGEADYENGVSLTRILSLVGICVQIFNALVRPIAPSLRGVSGTKSKVLESSGLVLSSGEIAEFIPRI